MDNVKEIIKNSKYGKSNYKLERDYQKDYDNDMLFRKICNKLELPTDTLMKYTTKIEKSACELKNCQGCKNILECKNEVEGYVYYPERNLDDVEFSYIPCKYKKEIDNNNKYLDNIYYFNINKDIKDASMGNIDTKDKNRFEVIKWIKEYLSSVKRSEYHKGLYLSGNFGCGKTFLVSALLHELEEKKNVSVELVYFPEILRELKSDWEMYEHSMKRYCTVDILCIDDIGAEKVSEWSRDEVLGTILQTRMNHNLTTFFTSNLTKQELENHFIMNDRADERIKARRIMERINQLTEDMELLSENRRK